MSLSRIKLLYLKMDVHTIKELKKYYFTVNILPTITSFWFENSDKAHKWLYIAGQFFIDVILVPTQDL